MLCIKLPVSIFERSKPKLRAHSFKVFGLLMGEKRSDQRVAMDLSDANKKRIT